MRSYPWPAVMDETWVSSAGLRLGGLATRSVTRSVAAGIEAYDRERHLPCLAPVTPGQLADETPESQRHIVARLARALRSERARGRAGHWTYDLNRHIGLKQAFAAERRRLADLLKRQPKTHSPPEGGE